MSKTQFTPESLQEAVIYFSNLDVCHEYMVRIKWPNGAVTCPKCGGAQVGEIKSRRMFQCKDKDCRKQFSTKIDTIFEDSPLGLDKWFVAVWCITSAKNGISSCELARHLKITQKSAWHLLHRVRLAMQTKSFYKQQGEIESDETMIGGKARNMHKNARKAKIKGTGAAGKVIVQGLLERGGKVRAMVVKDQKHATLQAEVRKHVLPGSAVYTDALSSYLGLDVDYIHAMIDHAKGYVEGRVHTNGIDNFWSVVSVLGNYTLSGRPVFGVLGCPRFLYQEL